MKKIIFVIFICIGTTVFAQKVDLTIAPENPIVLKYKLEHFNLKGDVYNYDSRFYFNKEGFLIRKSDYQGDNTYSYINGKLNWRGGLNDQGYITDLNGHKYTYNDKGLLTSDIETIPASYNKPLVNNTKKYTYDAQNRVVKEEEFALDVLKSTKTFKYKKEGTIVIVNTEEIKNSKTVLSEKRFNNGRLIYAKSNSDNIELKIESKLDDKGNSIKDAHIGNGTETDVFDYTIVYYSDANKPQNYTVYLKKGYGGEVNPQIYKNGSYFYTKLKTQIESTLDMLFYDDLTKNYYEAINAYDKTLTEGTTIKFELISKNNEVLLVKFENDKVFVFHNGKNISLNSTKATSRILLNHLFTYYIEKNTNNNFTFFFKNANEKKYSPGELLPSSPDHLYYYLDGKTNKTLLVHKGEYISQTTFSDFKNIGNYGLLGYFKGEPTYVLPEYRNMVADKIYIGHIYNSKTDTDIIDSKSTSNESSSSTTSQNSNCISGNCTNGFGEYKSLNGTLLRGFFYNNALNGFATQNFTSGDSYSGNFVNGKKEGYGIYFWKATNAQYYGEWKNDKINGYGYLVTNNKTIQAGIYSDAKLTTDLLIDYKNGKVIGENCMGNCSNGYGGIQYDNGDVYTGFFINGKPAKIGSQKWKNDNIFYTGQYNGNGEIHGVGMYVDATSVYNGGISNGKLTGLGIKTDKSTYKEIYGNFVDGKLVKDYSITSNTTTNSPTVTTTNSLPKVTCISGNCTEGFGEQKNEFSTITGFFTGGKANGYGKEVYQDGSGFYTGEFSDGLRNGFGMYTWNKDLSYYIGEWKDGKQHGYGYFKKGKEVYQAGYYENGKQTRNLLTQNYINKQAVGNCIGDCTNGFGYYQYTTNDKYVGFFTNGQINHVGAYTATSGDVFIGSILNGKFSGQGVQLWKSAGTSYYGNFSSGNRHGLGVYINNSNAIESKGYWDNGVLKTTY